MSPAAIVSRPASDEHSAFHSGYISLVQGNDILNELQRQGQETIRLLSGRSDAEADFRYAPNKWSVKEIVGHLCDSERVFAYRALRIARNDKTPLAGFEQDDYVVSGEFGKRQLTDLLAEFKCVRETTLALFRSLDEAAWIRRGLANNNEVSVRAIAYIAAGHELHHRKILLERYFKPPAVAS